MLYQNIVITGASTGLGFELARQLAKSSKNVIITSRDSKRLELALKQLKEGGRAQIYSFEADLSTTEGADAFLSYLESTGLQIDLFINNAGFGLSDYYINNNWVEVSEMIAVNVTTIAKFNHWAANHMKSFRNGTIINVSAMAALQAQPFFGAYGASRSFITQLSLALHEEMKDYGVKVVCAHPGSIKSQFDKRATISKTRAVRMLGHIPADYVAKIILKKAQRGKAFFIVGFPYKMIYLFSLITPRWLALKQMRFLFKPARSLPTT